MTEINQRLLKLITEDKTLNEISNELNLSNKQIMNRLRTIENNGYNLNRDYYNGDIRYSLITNFYKKDEPTIITRPNDKIFKVIFISDLHFGTTKESIEAINAIYNYCIKENIHIIINTGDIVHGKLQDSGIIKYEENYKDNIIKKKVLKKDFERKSQIDKFKNRYNIK